MNRGESADTKGNECIVGGSTSTFSNSAKLWVRPGRLHRTFYCSD